MEGADEQPPFDEEEEDGEAFKEVLKRHMQNITETLADDALDALAAELANTAGAAANKQRK